MDVATNRLKSVRQVDKTLISYKQLVLSVKEYGFINPILVNRRFEVIDGESRLAAAKDLKLTKVPVRVSHSR